MEELPPQQRAALFKIFFEAALSTCPALELDLATTIGRARLEEWRNHRGLAWISHKEMIDLLEAIVAVRGRHVLPAIGRVAVQRSNDTPILHSVISGILRFTGDTVAHAFKALPLTYSHVSRHAGALVSRAVGVKHVRLTMQDLPRCMQSKAFYEVWLGILNGVVELGKASATIEIDTSLASDGIVEYDIRWKDSSSQTLRNTMTHMTGEHKIKG